MEKSKNYLGRWLPVLGALLFSFSLLITAGGRAFAAGAGQDPADIQVQPLFHAYGGSVHPFAKQNAAPPGITPASLRAAYGLSPTSPNGSGTIAIIDAYDDPYVENDLKTFDIQFGLSSCTSANGCFTKHKMAAYVSASSSWGLEESLDTQWAHAIAPGAKILLVEARSSMITDLMSAVDYARSQAGVVAVSMSWGAGEFSSEAGYDSHFTGTPNITYFAASGDAGHSAGWPAVSPSVIGVGGTTLKLSGSSVLSETAWNGSGGGISTYESEPSYQLALAIANTVSHRGSPDVAFDADPNTGVAVHDSFDYGGTYGWFQIGGTSLGSPSWAALKAIDSQVGSALIYQEATPATYATYFRDISSGSNGYCGAVCTAAAGYDYVTGLGSPLGAKF